MSTVNDPNRVSTANALIGQRRKQRPLTIHFWGTESVFSTAVFVQLLKHVAIQSVVVPAQESQKSAIETVQPIATHQAANELPLFTPYIATTPVNLAWQHNIVTYGIHALHSPTVQEFLKKSAPDIVCVACFPWRIPVALLSVPTYGFVNVHPSKLPDFRGPAPLFWQLRAGLTESAVTLHRMAPAIDRGDIIASATVPLIEGGNSQIHDQNYAANAADLLTNVLDNLEQTGRIDSTSQPLGGSYQGWPTDADFVLERSWSARHAFNFMRGTVEWHRPYWRDSAGKRYALTQAVDYHPTAQLTEDVIVQNNTIAVQCNPGVLYARYQPYDG